MDAKRQHLKERKATVAKEKKPGNIVGQAHIQTGNDEEDPGEEEVHQDHEEQDDLNFAFMQSEGGANNMVTEQCARKTLKPSYIYLYSSSSFYQMFCKKYMTDMKQVYVALYSKCNGGKSHSDEKG